MVGCWFLGQELRGEGRKLAWRAADPEEARTGDAAAPVVWRTRASGRGVPERVRWPREESGPDGTTLTAGGEDSPATKGKSRLLFFLGVCVNVCGRRLSIKIESFKCCRVSGLFGILLLCAFGVLNCVLFVYLNCVLFLCH